MNSFSSSGFNRITMNRQVDQADANRPMWVGSGNDISTQSSNLCNSNDCRLEPFPSKLYKMLEDVHDVGLTNIISWSDDGKSFLVHKPKIFAKTLMQIYFNQSKYKSFQRQLNLYEFVRSPRDKILGVYSHPLFCRGNEERCKEIRRHVRKRHKNGKDRLDCISPTKSETVSTDDKSSSPETTPQCTSKKRPDIRKYSSLPNLVTSSVEANETEDTPTAGNTTKKASSIKRFPKHITPPSSANYFPYTVLSSIAPPPLVSAENSPVPSKINTSKFGTRKRIRKKKIVSSPAAAPDPIPLKTCSIDKTNIHVDSHLMPSLLSALENSSSHHDDNKNNISIESCSKSFHSLSLGSLDDGEDVSIGTIDSFTNIGELDVDFD